MPLHANDYVSPNFEVIDVDFAFPNLVNGDCERWLVVFSSSRRERLGRSRLVLL
jgi:hypothetical protein